MIYELVFVPLGFSYSPSVALGRSTISVKILLRFESIMQLSPTQHIMTISTVTSVCVIGIAWIILYSQNIPFAIFE